MIDETDFALPTVGKQLKRWAGVMSGRNPIDTLPPGDNKALAAFIRQAAFDLHARRCRLRQVPVLGLFAGLERVAVPLSMIDEESGHTNHAEGLYVAAISQLRNARRIFEFGTFIGRTTRHLAAMNPGAEVWTLDLPRDANPWRFADRVGSYFAGTPEAARIHFLREDARTFDPTPYRGTMDFIWVDADHSYDGVKNDSEKAFAMLAPGGAILWHDFGPDSLGLARYFAEFTQTRPLFRIARTSILVHLDGVDPETFTLPAIPFSKREFRTATAPTGDTSTAQSAAPPRL
jgi:predicted O-methyltransferase YrrM